MSTKYVPPHLRSKPGATPSASTATTEYHATATWTPAQAELKQWLILGGYKKAKGGVFSDKLKGKHPNEYYTIYFENALSLPGEPTVKRSSA